MDERSTLHSLGCQAAKHCYYLPNCPSFPNNWHLDSADAIAQLIAENGNHWRKIFTIMAKLSVIGTDWKNYRDSELLKQNEQILFGATSLNSSADLHLVIGSVSAEKLGLSHHSAQFKAIDEQEKVSSNGSDIILCPYLDYRQFPNILIEQTRNHLAANNKS